MAQYFPFPFVNVQMQNERPVASVGDFGVRLPWKPLHFNKRISTHMLLCLKWIFPCRTMTLIQEFFSLCNILHAHRRFLSSVHIRRSYIFRNSEGLLLLSIKGNLSKEDYSGNDARKQWSDWLSARMYNSLTSSAKRPRSIYQYSTWLRGFRVKIANFHCLSIAKRDLDTKKTTPNIEVWPESLGDMLEYIYIEHGLMTTWNFQI